MSWEVFGANENGLDWCCIEEVTSRLKACRCDFHVHWISRRVGVDNWWHRHVGDEIVTLPRERGVHSETDSEA
ncbi:unnamed protein product [Penicillium manginii]